MRYLNFKNFILLILFFVIQINVASAGLKEGFESGGMLENVARDSGVNRDLTIDSMIAKVIEIALSFLGVIFLVLMLYGGYLWMTARGEESRVETAKKLINAAVIGLLLVISAYVISYFVVDSFSNNFLK